MAIALLVINDWVFKPRWHGAITGKLSDIAGLAFAPVVLSAAVGLALHVAARLGARVDPSLSRRRLLVCIAATAIGFTAVKLVPAAGDALANVIGHGAEFYPDRTDLWCLPAVLVALWIGRDELRRVPLGKPAALHRDPTRIPKAVGEIIWAGADGDDIGDLIVAITAWDVPRIDALLRQGAR
jgi:hypothetical protein